MLNLAKLRNDRGLSQTRLAKIIGVSTSTVSMWETGEGKPNYHMIAKMCDYFGVSFEQFIGGDDARPVIREEIAVPVLGYVRAGRPNDATQQIIGYETISADLAKEGEIFGLRVKGASMEPKFSDGDTVLVLKKPEVENGQIAVVVVGNEEATVKKVSFQKEGITLIPTNPDFMPIYYTAAECRDLPVTIAGLVVELRSRSFNPK